MRVSSFLTTSIVLLFSSSVLAETGCPLAGKCPYYDKAIEKGGEGKGCPLANKNCPYFEQHVKDSSLVDVLTTADGSCPLSKALKSCPFYSKMSSDEPLEVDWTGNKCPLSGKCPYYDDVKANNTKAFHCPILTKCPHFQNKKEGQVVRDYDVKGEECPFMKAARAKKEAEEVNEDL